MHQHCFSFKKFPWLTRQTPYGRTEKATPSRTHFSTTCGRAPGRIFGPPGIKTPYKQRLPMPIHYLIY